MLKNIFFLEILMIWTIGEAYSFVMKISRDLRKHKATSEL